MKNINSIYAAVLSAMMFVFVCGAANAAHAATFAVNSTADTTDTAINGVCETAAGNGICTLRAAIQEANATAAADSINFNFPGIGTGVGGTFIIATTGLPVITQPVVIDGYTQPGASANTLPIGNDAVLRVELVSTNFAGPGFDIDAANVTIRGFIIHKFTSSINIRNTNAVIEGCWSNILADGSAATGGSSGYGVFVRGTNATIGGLAPAARNVLSGNSFNGVYLERTNATVQNNYIGTNPAGTLARANARGGILIANSNGAPPSGGNIIGGLTAEARNLISGNAGNGIQIANTTTTGNTIQGNYIGVGANGTTSIPNTLYGIDVRGNNTLIGGTAGLTVGDCTGACNRIANTTGSGHGIEIFSPSVGTRILGNSIYNNVALGIDLGGNNAVTPNDLADPDTGANNLQNFPVILSAIAGSGGRITGSLNSNPNQNYRIEFFSSPNASGNNEGQNFLGFVDTMTDGSGNSPTFELNDTSFTNGQIITATATNTGTNDTSEFSAPFVPGSSFVVNSTDDTTDAAINGVCETAAGGGVCTLRAAIQEANATVVADKISFNIAGIGVQTITLNSRLPDISNVVTIDGYTQPGATANTLAVGNNAVLRIQITANTNIDRFFTTLGGSATLRGLVINGYSSTGVAFFSSDNNIIEGCFIGTDADGTTRGSLANQSTGILISVGSPNSIGTLVGGTTPASRNLISGNGTFGVNASGAHVIQNNYIGTNAAGTGAILNGPATIGISASVGTLIGGVGANLRNVISGNNGSGISLIDNNVTQPVFVLGNYIGTAADGVTPLGNAGDGITLSTSAGNQIGNGTAAGANIIANNGGAGILNASSNGFAAANRISVNSIYNNGGLGIDLSNIGTSDGATLNDAGDADTGANNLQNFPVLTSVSSGSTRVIGTLSSTPSRTFRLEFFSVPTADASGFGEGQTFIGTTNVTTDGSGAATFDQTFAPNTPVGQFVAATATDLTTNDTSEFSQARQVSDPTASSISISGRVTTGKRGIRNALVTLTEQNGTTRTVLTGVSGAYRFDGVTAGQTVIVSVRAKRFTFSQPTQIFTVTEDFADINFYADENF